ncbi:MAG: bifunctional phosphopantothenoylcysteine decarboxylase/phosphopantothenate--cysteine ligase CoaBC [bacterium]|nr:bifunctional phosphopantothenoylcysteine decarboxylase/phosphopantothenate--cysteine ligase CoaBC [bacterium]
MSNVLIGVTGCIAAYKAAALVREFKKAGFDVKVILTKNGSKFITPLTLKTLSGNKVYESIFDDENEYSTEHIALSSWADILVVAPASADVIGKFANGIADDLLSTEYLAFDKKVLIAPTMNNRMYEHPAVRKNISMLKERGVFVIEPDTGFLACGEEGKGRFPEVKTIVMHAKKLIHRSRALEGKRVIITGGGTIVKIDPVRILANLSSGIMADCFINAAFLKKAESITYIHGRITVSENPLSENVKAETSAEMLEEVKKRIAGADLLIMAAAVNDFKTEYSGKKIKKKDLMTLSLKKDIDILSELKKSNTKALKIGFALESENGDKKPLAKMKEKDLDFIVVNSPSNLSSLTGSVKVLAKNGKTLTVKNASKEEIADKVLEWIKF